MLNLVYTTRLKHCFASFFEYYPIIVRLTVLFVCKNPSLWGISIAGQNEYAKCKRIKMLYNASALIFLVAFVVTCTTLKAQCKTDQYTRYSTQCECPSAFLPQLHQRRNRL